MSAVSLGPGKFRAASGGTFQAVSWLSWGPKVSCPKMREGGVYFPDPAAGPYQFSASRQFESFRAALLKRILVDAEGANKRLPDSADWVGRQREVFQAPSESHCLPVTGT